jgi:hypothetical protein
MAESIYSLLTSKLDGSEWSASRPCHFTTEERAPGTHRTGGRVGPKADLVSLEKRKSLLLLRIERRQSSPSPTAVPTELSKLHILLVLFANCMCKPFHWICCILVATVFYKINEANEFIHFTLIHTESNNVFTKVTLLTLATDFTYVAYGETKCL